MFNKLYDFFKGFIKNYYPVLIVLFVVIFINYVKVPYEIMMPGGMINLTDRISIDGEKVDLDGSFNMAYVSVVSGSIPYYLVGKYIIDDWDVYKMETDTYDQEFVEEDEMRSKLDLKQSKNVAKVAAFNAAGIKYEIGNKFNYVTYIIEGADTTLKVGDDVRKVNGNVISDIEELRTIISNSNKDDIINFEVERNGKLVNATAKVLVVDGENKINVGVLTTYDIISDINVEIGTRESESGPSGGMMMALMVYNAITKQDLTNGLNVVGTGTIDEDGNVGEIGGIKYKVIGAYKQGANIFLVPKGNYEDAVEVQKEKGYNDLEIVCVEKLEDAIKYLENKSNSLH